MVSLPQISLYSEYKPAVIGMKPELYTFISCLQSYIDKSTSRVTLEEILQHE